MNDGNILTLQKILGHSDIGQTMEYAHLAPDYLQDAVKLNPFSMCRKLENTDFANVKQHI